MWFSICVHSHPNINIPFLPRPKVVFFCFVLLYIFCIFMVGTVRTWGEFHYISLKPMKERKKGHAYTETITIHIKMPQTQSDFRLVHQLRFAWYFKSSLWSQLLCCTDTELIFPHQTYHYRSAHADLQSSSFSRNLQLFFFHDHREAHRERTENASDRSLARRMCGIWENATCSAARRADTKGVVFSLWDESKRTANHGRQPGS